MSLEDDLRKKFEEQMQEKWVGDPWNAKYCMKCRYSHGEPPWADLPRKAYCMVYRREDGISKPYDIVHFGAKCKYFRPE